MGLQKNTTIFGGGRQEVFLNSPKLFCNFIEIALRHGCSPVNLLHIFRTLFPIKAMDGCFSIFSLYENFCILSDNFYSYSLSSFFPVRAFFHGH